MIQAGIAIGVRTMFNNLREKIKRIPLFIKILSLLILLIAFAYLSIVVTVWPQDYFWVERENATMPVWVRGNFESNVFVIFNHGGPGSCGTLESIVEVNPGNGRMDHESPFKVLEDKYAMVYWDQRHACMSKGSADPNDSRPDDFGQDLAVVIDELEKRYDVQKIFIIGQSWGHTVATNYLTAADDWRENQGKIDGYIIYKGNHDLAMPYEIVKPQILEHAQQQINNYTDVEHWQEVKTFYEERPTLTTASDFAEHGHYVFSVMGSPISLSDRILASVKASLFSPFNGLPVYPNNKRTNQAEEFMSFIASDTSMTEVVHRIDIPTLLVYGRKDLMAPVGVGEFIYNEIDTDEADKTLLILEQSRHGAENGDIEILQRAVFGFIETYR